MIEKIIVRKAIKADRFYIPGEVLFPPFSPSIMAEVNAGTGMMDVYFQNEKKVYRDEGPALVMDMPADKTADKPVDTPVSLSTGTIDTDSRKILFRKFEQLEVLDPIKPFKPRPLRGTSPPWFLGRYAPKKKKLLFRQFDKLEG